MSISQDKFCLGGLMKNNEKESNINDLDSKDETEFKSSIEQKFSSQDSDFSSFSSNLFSPALELCNPSYFSINNILMTFKDQKLTKELQKNLLYATQETINNILKELSGSFRTIIKNKNGNYFCTDLLKVCNKEQRLIILKELSINLSEDCIDDFATYPIQKLIELSSSEEEYKLLLFSFNDLQKILIAAMNQNGTFVIQKLIVYIPEKSRIEFNFLFVKLFCILSRDMYGVCAVKKFIGYSKDELILKEVLNSLITNFVNISENQYGNYLIQYLLEKWWKTNEGEYIKSIIISKFQILSKNQYSCYICHLFLRLCSIEEKKLLFSSLNNNKFYGKNNNFKNKTSLKQNTCSKTIEEKNLIKFNTFDNYNNNTK